MSELKPLSKEAIEIMKAAMPWVSFTKGEFLTLCDMALASLSRPPAPVAGEACIKLVENIVNANGPYPYVNGTGLVMDAYRALSTLSPSPESWKCLDCGPVPCFCKNKPSPESGETCPECEGGGYILIEQHKDMPLQETCDNCHGKGRAPKSGDHVCGCTRSKGIYGGQRILNGVMVCNKCGKPCFLKSGEGKPL